MTDAIEVRGIACYGYHGHHEEERRLGQRFIVDLQLQLNLQPAGQSDDLDLGVDYSAAIRVTRNVVEGEPCMLIEAVAEQLAQRLLDEFLLLEGVEVCVHKPNAPIAGPPVADVAVRVQRSRTA